MSVRTKSKVNEEHRILKPKWSDNYYFIERKDKPVCLIGNATVAVPKEFNLKRHYESTTKAEFDKLTDIDHQCKVNELKKKLRCQQNIFLKIEDQRSKSVLVT